MAITNDFDLTRKKDEKKDEKKTSFNDRLNALLEKATDEPANKRSREAVAQLQETGRTTYRGESYTLPETQIPRQTAPTPAQQSSGSALSSTQPAAHMSGKLPSGLALPTAAIGTHMSGKLGEPAPRPATGADVDAALKNREQARKGAVSAGSRWGDALSAFEEDLSFEDYAEAMAKIRATEEESRRARQTAESASAAYDALAADYQQQKKERTYGVQRYNPDFAAKSQGDEETALKNVGKAYYRIFHRNDTAAPVSWGEQSIPGATWLGKGLEAEMQRGDAPSYASTYSQITDDEAALYFYLWNTPDKGNGPKAANAYLKMIEPELNARKAAADQLSEAEYARRNPVGASAMSVSTNLAGGVMGMVDLTAQNIGQKLGSRKPIDYNTPLQMPGKTTQNIRGAVAQKLEDNYPDSSLFGLTNLASFAYQTGMSMIDSGLQAYAVGLVASPVAGIQGTAQEIEFAANLVENVGLGIMGSNAAQQAVYTAKERGASDSDALLSGYAAGFAEALFEKLSMDKLVHNIIARQGMSIGDKLTSRIMDTTVRRIASGAIDIGIQGGVEASEEVFTTLANTLTDLAINKERSEILTNVQRYEDEGMSETEALKLAWKEWLKGVASDALGGLASGGVMGGAGYLGNYYLGGGLDTDRAERAQREYIDLQRKGLAAEASYEEAMAAMPEDVLAGEISEEEAAEEEAAEEGTTQPQPPAWYNAFQAVPKPWERPMPQQPALTLPTAATPAQTDRENTETQPALPAPQEATETPVETPTESKSGLTLPAESALPETAERGTMEPVEEAKQELRNTIRMPVQGKNVEALEQGAKTGELTMDSVTIGGKAPGFTKEQQISLATQIIEAQRRTATSSRQTCRTTEPSPFPTSRRPSRRC